MVGLCTVGLSPSGVVEFLLAVRAVGNPLPLPLPEGMYAEGLPPGGPRAGGPHRYPLPPSSGARFW